MFNGCVITVDPNVNLKDKKLLRKSIIDHGGVVTYIIAKKNTHVVIQSPEDAESSYLCDTAHRYNVPVVTCDFIYKCVEEGKLVDTYPYRVSLKQNENGIEHSTVEPPAKKGCVELPYSDENITMLCSMGFSNLKDVRKALQLSRNDLNEAAAILTGGLKMSSRKKNPSGSKSDVTIPVFDQITIKEEEVEENITKELNTSIPACNELLDTLQCNLCHKDFKEKDEFVKHECLYTGNNKEQTSTSFDPHGNESSLYPFQCNICHKGFKRQGNFKKHDCKHTSKDTAGVANNLNSRENNVLNPFQCDMCFKSFKKKDEFKKHICIKTGKTATEVNNGTLGPSDNNALTLFQCNICHKNFKKKAYFKIHVCTKNAAELSASEPCKNNASNLFKCSMCPERFKKKADLKKHQCLPNSRNTAETSMSLPSCENNASNIFKCDMCGKSFKKEVDFKKHQCIHNGKRKLQLPTPSNPRDNNISNPFQCQLCHKSFKLKVDLGRHVCIHSGKKPIQSKPPLASNPIDKDVVQPFECSVCSRSFVNKFDFGRHECMPRSKSVVKKNKSVDPCEKEVSTPFNCKICNQSFQKKDDLGRHHCTHTAKKAEDHSKNPTVKTGEGPWKCNICNKVYQYQKRLQSHLSTHNDMNNYHCDVCGQKGKKHVKCDWCGKCFGKISLLKKHYNAHKDKPALCFVCKKSFKTREELLSHTDTHKDLLDGLIETTKLTDVNTNPKPTKVRKDMANSDKEPEWLNEESVAAEEDAILNNVTSDTEETGVADDDDELDEYEVCTVCKKVITSKKEFIDHMQSHIEELNAIDAAKSKENTDNPISSTDGVNQNVEVGNSGIMVRKTSRRARSVVKNQDDGLKEETVEEQVKIAVKYSLDPCDYEALKPFRCTVCRKCFKVKADLRKHERIHTGEKPYECPVCGKAFAIAGNLSKHRAVHSTERPWVCKICNKAYKLQKHLSSHMNIHSGIKNYHCDICGKDFVHSWSWHCHMSNHSGVFKYHCDVCKKGFNITTDYRRHMFVHGGDRPLKCEFCEKRFAHGTLLKRHIAIHHTARNLKCNRCGKVFDLLADFKAHKLTHKGEKHLKCEWCGKGFGKLSHLTRHYKVHKNKPNLCSVCKKSFRTKEELLEHTETHIDIMCDQEETTDLNDAIAADTADKVDLENNGNASDTASDEEETVSLNDVTSDTEEPIVAEEDDELEEYEVCTVCKKVLTSEKEFLTHMQSHIDEINALDEAEARGESTKTISSTVIQNLYTENTESSETGGDTTMDESLGDDDDDDDVICTKITNEVTGKTVVFLKDNEASDLVDDTNNKSVNGEADVQHMVCDGSEVDDIVSSNIENDLHASLNKSNDINEEVNVSLENSKVQESGTVDGDEEEDKEADKGNDSDNNSGDDDEGNRNEENASILKVDKDGEEYANNNGSPKEDTLNADTSECLIPDAEKDNDDEDDDGDEDEEEEDEEDGDDGNGGGSGDDIYDGAGDDDDDNDDGDDDDNDGDDDGDLNSLTEMHLHEDVVCHGDVDVENVEGNNNDEEKVGVEAENEDEVVDEEECCFEDGNEAYVEHGETDDVDAEEEADEWNAASEGEVEDVNGEELEEPMEEGVDVDEEHVGSYEMVPLSSINDYQLKTSAEIINGNEKVVNVLISIDQGVEDEYSVDQTANDSVLFAEKVNGDHLESDNCLRDRFLNQPDSSMEEYESNTSITKVNEGQNIVLNHEIEFDMGGMSNDFSQIMEDDDPGPDNDMDMGIPWAEYAMKADDN